MVFCIFSSAISSPAPCPKLSRPTHGWIYGTDFRHEKQVRFGCSSGYQRVGSSSVTCNDGKWSNELPVCKGEMF